MIRISRGRLLASTLLAAVAVTPAWAQTPPPVETQNPDSRTGQPQSNDAGGRPAEVEPARGSSTSETGTIIVTGTRVARPNATSISPITTVGQEDIKEFGATKIEDLTNSLPQVFAGQSSGVSNGADGTATVDLRGLGPTRTLVLVDGRRLGPGAVGGSQAADLNFIPAPLVSSVDLLTGGASATYGADAVAGVVNFKMNRNFRGVRFDGQYTIEQHNNRSPLQTIVGERFAYPSGNRVLGPSYEATLIVGAGTDDNRGSLVAYAGYRNDTAISQDRYDYSACTFNPGATRADGLPDITCGGSGTPQNPRFGGFAAANRTAAGLPAAGSYTLDPTTGRLRPFVASDQFNFAPTNYYRRPSERFTGGVFAAYEVTPGVQPYLDVMFMDYRTDAQIAPSGLFYGTRTVNCDNPLLLANPQLATAACGANVGTTNTTSILIGKRNTEGAPRNNRLGYQQFRIVTGVKGVVNDAIAYDAYYSVNKSNLSEVYQNDFSNSRINNALNVRNVNGTPTCVVGNTTTPVGGGCVPYNIFNAGGITPAAVNYLAIPLVQIGEVREETVNGTLTINLGKYGFSSPFATDGLRLALGVENRVDTLTTQPDANYINNDGAGQGGPTLPINGRFSVRDLFVEAGLPLITERPFFSDLSINAGYRNSRYNYPGRTAAQPKTDTYKVGFNWSIIPEFAIRASYNRAVRSPNLGDAFAGNQVALFSGSDPCAGPAVNGLVNGNTFAQCARTGVTAATFGNITPNSAAQYNQIIGGNPDLNPEPADTYSAGVVVKPRILGGNLVLSADYFNIKLKNAVSTVGAQIALQQCLQTGDPAFCSLIVRGPDNAGGAAGTLWLTASGQPIGYVNNRTVNTGSLSTKGIDVNADFRTRFGSNRIRAQFVGTYLQHYRVQPFTGGFTYDCARLYGLTCGSPNPQFRFNTNVKLTTANDFGFTVRWRYLGPATNDQATDDPNLAGSSTANDRRIRAFSYYDVLFSVPVNQKAVFRLGVNNVFDRQPPIVSQGALAGTVGNGNTFPGTYDALGRTIFANVTADF